MDALNLSGPITVGDRVVVNGDHEDHADMVGAAGTVVDQEGQMIIVKLDEKVDGYSKVMLLDECVIKSPYRNEELVAVNNHD